jgi:hypothetical protein
VRQQEEERAEEKRRWEEEGDLAEKRHGSTRLYRIASRSRSRGAACKMTRP